MLLLPKSFIRQQALILKSILEEKQPDFQIEIEYTKLNKKRIIHIYQEVLGGEWDHLIVFKERPLEPEEKSLLMVQIGLISFLFFTIAILGAVIGSVIFGYSLTYLNLFLYLMNIGGLACSIYVLNNGIKWRSVPFLALGFVLLCMHAYQIFTFFEEYL